MNKTLFFLLLINYLSLFAQETIKHRSHTFDIYKVDVSQANIELYLEDSLGQKYRSLDKVKQLLERQNKKMIFATNAGMYLPHKDNEPQGLYIANGQERSPLNLRDTSIFLNFYLKPNGIFLITKNKTAHIIESSQYLNIQGTPQLATQSGPMLVINNKIHYRFNEPSTSRYIRSGVGIIDSTHIVFAISNQPVNFFTFATLFKNKLKCENALYLDGAISKMYIPALQRDELGGNFGGIIAISREDK